MPALDEALLRERPDAGEALSAGAGPLGLWRGLRGLGIEQAPAAELLLFYAALADETEDSLSPVLTAEAQEEQWAQLEARLRGEPLPRPSWWRRLARSGAGGLGDRARLQVQRGALIVLERLPPPPEEADADLFETDLGELAAGDRLTLQLPAPLPGRIAVLHAVGDEEEAELSVLLPASAAEEAPRRALEVIEVSGEVEPVAGTGERSLIVLWAPELLPAGWYRQVAPRRRLPPEARLWRYRYRVGDAKGRAE